MLYVTETDESSRFTWKRSCQIVHQLISKNTSMTTSSKLRARDSVTTVNSIRVPLSRHFKYSLEIRTSIRLFLVWKPFTNCQKIDSYSKSTLLVWALIEKSTHEPKLQCVCPLSLILVHHYGYSITKLHLNCRYKICQNCKNWVSNLKKKTSSKH